MTIAGALTWAARQLGPSPSATVDARLLLQHVLHKPRTHLISHGDDELTEAQRGRYQELVIRAAQHEPVPYLTGSAPFYGLEFAVTPDVLIPRPETEFLVEAALNWAQSRTTLRVVDVGTGSGCIAVILARQLSAATIVAVDVSATALAIARQNAVRHGVGDTHHFYPGFSARTRRSAARPHCRQPPLHCR
jgi:release factor glutamine methyltransferase